MITKIKRLKNIGKFYDFSAQANTLDWCKNTFVFAPNAYGKSTVVNVFRSLRDNNPKLVRGRKTLGVAAGPEAVIVIDGANHVFNGTRWEKHYSAIQIFDAPFIHDNILAHEIGHEHKKNIHKIIIGAQGIKLAEELAILKFREKAKSQEVDSLVSRFSREAFSLTLDGFLAVPPEDEAAVEPRIQKLEQDVKSKQSERVVHNLGFPRLLAALLCDVSNMKVVAAEKISVAHKAAENRMLAHIDLNFKDKAQARQFIRDGLDLVQKNCPFCGQDIRNVADLLQAYRDVFNDAFKAFQDRVIEQVVALRNWNLDNELTSLVSTHNANLATLRQWEPFLCADAFPDAAAKVDECRARLVDLKNRVLYELEKKQKDPNADTDLIQFDALAVELTSVRIVIEDYNEAVSAFTKKATQYVAELPKSDVASIQLALAKEKEIGKRFETEWKKWVADYKAAKYDANNFTNQKNAKQIELDAYSKSIFDMYQKRINELLSTLGTDFSITGLTGRTSGQAKVTAISIFLSWNSWSHYQLVKKMRHPSKTHSAKATRALLPLLSSSRYLEKTPELEKQIVILDDPLSSLDETRREATARMLLALSPDVNQLAVFTHKRDFLYMLCDKIPENHVLQVRSDKMSGSRLEFLDVEEERKSDHARLVENMERYVNEDFGPSADTMQGNLRKLFEVVLKTKYYRILAADIKAKRGFAILLTTLFNAGLLDAALKPRLFDLCSVANGAHHGEIVDAIPKRLTRDELLPLIREALDFVQQV